MSQPPQPAYGGRPGYGTYNAPPPSNFTGYPPVSSTPQQGYGGAPPQHGPPSQVPPVGSSLAFFMVPPGNSGHSSKHPNRDRPQIHTLNLKVGYQWEVDRKAMRHKN
jgi:signal transducing adaptor molecule